MHIFKHSTPQWNPRAVGLPWHMIKCDIRYPACLWRSWLDLCPLTLMTCLLFQLLTVPPACWLSFSFSSCFYQTTYSMLLTHFRVLSYNIIHMLQTFVVIFHQFDKTCGHMSHLLFHRAEGFFIFIYFFALLSRWKIFYRTGADFLCKVFTELESLATKARMWRGQTVIVGALVSTVKF